MKVNTQSYKWLMGVGSLLLVGVTGLQAQQDVVASGLSLSSPAGSVSYTVGQVNYIHIKAEGGSVNLGVQQPNVTVMVGTDDQHNDAKVSVFPNPASQQLFIDCKEGPVMADRNPITCQLWDIKGMFILEQNLADPLTTLNLSLLPEGLYMLKLIRNHTAIQTFKIIKSN